MSAPQVDQLPAYPTRTEQQANFDALADAHVAALPAFVDQVNIVSTFVNGKADEAAASETEAAAQATEATEQAVIATEQANIASAASNFQGVWSGSTGYTTGQTVSHNDAIWIALQNSTGSEPALGNANWLRILITGGAPFRYLYG